MRGLGRGVLAVAAMLFAAWPGTGAAIPFTREVVVSSADDFFAPPGVTLLEFGDVNDVVRYIAVDASGGIFFEARGFFNDRPANFGGIFSVAAGSSTPTTLVATGQTTPAGGTYGSEFNFVANDAGTVAFHAFFFEGDSETAGLFGIRKGGTPSLVISNDSLSQDSLVSVTDANDVIFAGAIGTDAAVEGLRKRSIDGGGIQTIAAAGESAPGLAGTFRNIGGDREDFPITTNAAGDLTFADDISPDDGSRTIRDAFFHTRDGVTRLIGFDNGPPPNASDGFSWSVNEAFVAPSGDLVVLADFKKVEGGPSFNGVWYGSQPNDLQLIIEGDREGNPSVAFGADGKFFFSLVTAEDDTFFAFDPGNLEFERLLDNDTEAFDIDDNPLGRLFDYNPIGVTDDGAVVFFANSFSDESGFVDGFYALETDGSLTALVREGDEIDGKTVSNLPDPAEGQSAFNGNTLAIIVDDGEIGDNLLRIVIESEAPTNFVWTGACNSTNWHDTNCGAPTNWIGSAGEVVAAPPGDGAGDENATIAAATVRIFNRDVVLDTLTATGKLELIDTLTLNGPSSIVNLQMASSGKLISNGETTLTGVGNMPGGGNILRGLISTQGDGVVINEGRLQIASPIVFLEGTFRNRGTVNQLGIFDVTGRIENKNIWNLDSANLTETAPGGGRFLNDGTLVNVSGNSSVALFYGGGNGSKIQAQEVDSVLSLTGGGAFVGATTIDVGTNTVTGLKPSVQLDGAGPDKTVYTVTGTIATDAEPAVAGILTVRNSADRSGKFVIGPNAALNIEAGNRLVSNGADIVLAGGDLTGRVEITSVTSPGLILGGRFVFEAGRLGIAGEPAARADMVVDSQNSVLEISGEATASRTLVGDILIEGRAIQRASLNIQNSAIQIDGQWTIEAGNLSSDAVSTLSIGKFGQFELKATDPVNTTVSFAGVLDNLNFVVVSGGRLNFDGAVAQVTGNELGGGQVGRQRWQRRASNRDRYDRHDRRQRHGVPGRRRRAYQSRPDYQYRRVYLV